MVYYCKSCGWFGQQCVATKKNKKKIIIPRCGDCSENFFECGEIVSGNNLYETIINAQAIIKIYEEEIFKSEIGKKRYFRAKGLIKLIKESNKKQIARSPE